MSSIWKYVLPIVLTSTLVLATSPKELRANDEYRYMVRMDHQTFIPEAGDLSAGIEYLAANTDLGMVHLFVQMDQVRTAGERDDLASRGLVLQGYIPENTYYALVSTEMTAEEMTALGVRWAGPIGYEAKISERVREKRFGSWSSFEAGKRIFAVQFHRDVSESEAQRILLEKGGIIGQSLVSIDTQIVALDPNRVDELAEVDPIKYVTEISPPLSAGNNSNRVAVEIDIVNSPPYGLTGVGSNVLVYDAGVCDLNHPDFGGRAIHGESSSIGGHATHVAGTVGGNGANSGGTYAGMAPETAITSYSYESCNPNCLYNSPQDIEENYAEGYQTYNAMFATNSLTSNIAPNGYDCDWEGDYEITAQLLDAICRGSLGKPFLSIWCNGNERGYGNCGTAYGTTGVPATGKDIIAVGATNSNDHSMTWFSSWGPVDDGRMRPDICAPGCQSNDDNGVTSTDPGGDYSVKCGTSMSTPTVAGLIALIRQEGRRHFGFPLDPKPATIKSILVNNCVDYGNAGPDYQFGFGEVRATQAIDHLKNDKLLVESSLEQGQSLTYEIQVDGLDVLKATLAWDDPPGEILAAKELINDLDVVLESPSRTVHQAWVLNPASPSSAATRGVDRLNPCEMVEVSNPENGTWTVRVTGFQVPDGPQTFSVVANAPAGATVDVPGDTEVAEGASGLGDLANFPNPFLPRTTIRFRTEDSAPIDLEVFDARGRLVRSLLEDATRPAGTQFVTWDGRNDSGEQVVGGVYFYQVRSGEASLSEKMIVLQ